MKAKVQSEDITYSFVSCIIGQFSEELSSISYKGGFSGQNKQNWEFLEDLESGKYCVFVSMNWNKF